MKQGLPKFGELVICKVKRISQFAAWCDLEEYQNLEGMIHISEVAGKWVHDIKKFVKPGKQYIAKVVKVDPNTNTVNLSLKRVSNSEERSKWNEFRKEQRAESIIKIISQELKYPLEKVYERIAFPLNELFGDLYTGLEEIKKSPDVLKKLNIPKKWHDILLNVLKKSFVEKEFMLKAELEMQSYEGDGIKRIKKILKMLKNERIDVKYISAPKYLLEIKTKTPKTGKRLLEQNIEKAISEAKKLNLEVKYNLIES